MAAATISAFVTGDFLAPPGHRVAGQRVVAVAYLVRHPDAVLLVDTGFPYDAPFSVHDAGVEIMTYPRSVDEALQRLGTTLDGVDLVANCHLHIDHAGGNHRLPATTPIHVQGREIDEAAAETETDPIVRDALRLDERSYRRLDGETELLPGILAIPTPGHTTGHQSFAVETVDGIVLLGGQAMPSAAEFGLAMYARRLADEASDDLPPTPEWLERVAELAPVRAHFAHDMAVWERERVPG